MKFLDVLTQMGCTVTEKTGGIEVTGPAEGALKGIEIDMNDFSDQALTLAAMAPFCNSDVHITHIGHIRGQECDRLHAMSEELTKRGITCTEEPDAITIKPGTPFPGIVSTYEDHRVAMSFALLGLKVDGIVIDNPSCCRKTSRTTLIYWINYPAKTDDIFIHVKTAKAKLSKTVNSHGKLSMRSQPLPEFRPHFI